jgi:hypothetical protein
MEVIYFFLIGIFLLAGACALSYLLPGNYNQRE